MILPLELFYSEFLNGWMVNVFAECHSLENTLKIGFYAVRFVMPKSPLEVTA